MTLSEREWTVLGALWETDGAELGTLVNILFPETGWNRNTVLTYLTRMEAKGLVSIDKNTSPHIYRATLDRESCQKEERHSFLKRVYSGSAGDLIAAFLKEEAITAEERDELRRLLDDMEV
ncbi:MAG: BlaI/MecI/CopY family transcriptional regulator [Clostridia bacterium]|nr:BlaI/MecI/CopY family transcriptional regulator [Clostridia bacterium]